MHEQQHGEGFPAVTTSVPGQPCDRQLPVTVMGLIGSHTFTLLFRGGASAVLHVHGALDQDEARTFACGVLPGYCYEVKDGDETNGHVAPFHAWTSAVAQEAYWRACGAPQPKVLEDITDAELDQMCDRVDDLINRLRGMDVSLLAERERQRHLNAALDLAEVLVLEQMCRLVGNVVRQIQVQGPAKQERAQ